MKRDCGELLLVWEAALRGIVSGPVAPHREQDARQLACQRDCRYELSSTLFDSKCPLAERIVWAQPPQIPCSLDQCSAHLRRPGFGDAGTLFPIAQPFAIRRPVALRDSTSQNCISRAGVHLRIGPIAT